MNALNLFFIIHLQLSFDQLVISIEKTKNNVFKLVVLSNLKILSHTHTLLSRLMYSKFSLL